jgi:hypothetical protein
MVYYDFTIRVQLTVQIAVPVEHRKHVETWFLNQQLYSMLVYIDTVRPTHITWEDDCVHFDVLADGSINDYLVADEMCIHSYNEWCAEHQENMVYTTADGKQYAYDILCAKIDDFNG